MRKNSDIPSRRLMLSRFCACFGNPTILAILEELAKRGDSDKEHFLELKGVSSFTINMNLKYLKKYGLVKGSLSPETPYCIDYEGLEEGKKQFDAFYNKLMKNKKLR
jgi:hypothetical protein